MFKKRALLIALIMIFTVPLYLTAASGKSFVATNSWTAAYAKAAGVKNIIQLAPSEMVHPPEYELKPSDVIKIKNADYLVFAGYEVLMKTVFKNFKKPKESMIKIFTGYNPSLMKKSIRAIAAKAGTRKQSEKSISEIDNFFKDAKKALKKKGIYGKPVIVHFHQRPFAEALGFKVSGVFGPGPLKAKQIASLSKKQAVLIIDNAHNPMASPIAEIKKLKTVELVNFPGFKSKSEAVPSTLIGVMNYNLKQLIK